jgi:branched-chain amino acid transport system substrate-binding protein
VKYLALILFAVLMITACSDDDNTTTTETVKIGFLMPGTGSGASVGASAQVAADIAIEQINAKLSDAKSNYRFAYELMDTETDPATALAQLEALNNKGIKFVVGPYSSSSAEECLDYANANDMIICSPSSVANSLAIADDNLFRLVPSDLLNAEATTALLKDDGIEYVSAYIRDDIWGRNSYYSFKESFEKIDGNKVEGSIYELSKRNFSGLGRTLNNLDVFLKSRKKAGILFFSFEESTDILEDLSNYNGNLDTFRFYGSSAFANNRSILSNQAALDFAQEHGGFKCPIFGYDEDQKAEAEALIARIEAKINRTPEIYALCAYDAMMLAYETYKASEYKQPESFIDFKTTFVAKANAYTGVTGSTKLNEFGDRESGNFFNWGIGEDNKWKVFSVYESDTKTIVKK